MTYDLWSYTMRMFDLCFSMWNRSFANWFQRWALWSSIPWECSICVSRCEIEVSKADSKVERKFSCTFLWLLSMEFWAWMTPFQSIIHVIYICAVQLKYIYTVPYLHLPSSPDDNKILLFVGLRLVDHCQLTAQSNSANFKHNSMNFYSRLICSFKIVERKAK